MESEPPHNRTDEPASPGEREGGRGSVSLLLRLWAYRGPSQPLSALAVDQEPEIGELIRGIIRESKGVVFEPEPPNFFLAHFDNASNAVSTAKALQQRFLTHSRKTEPKQVISGILIFSTHHVAMLCTERSGGAAVLEDMVANGKSAQILVSGSIYEPLRKAPDCEFNPKPVGEAGESSAREPIYELLWRDRPTYGHPRQPIRTPLRAESRYKIQEELGRGAMGAVYKAYDQVIGRTVALKIISIDQNTPNRDDLSERLKREAKAAGKLDHPNIITVYDVGEDAGVIYLSMQFLQGKTLLTYLDESGVPSLPILISWADQILSAVGFAHSRGVIHRDLKPANLMLTDQGIIKVLDFGIAKVENVGLTQTGLVVGTPSHMAPEQVAGKRVDSRADIFALGLVFYELVTREKAFRGDIATILYKIVHEDPPPPSLINPALPGGVDAIIRKALAKDPSDRFQTCGEMRNAFHEQAALLNIASAASVPINTAVAKRATPTPATFSIHLLEDTAPQPLTRIWPDIAAGLALLLVGTITWSLYASPQAGSLRLRVRNLLATVHHALPQLSSSAATIQGPSGQQPHRVISDHAGRNSIVNTGISAGENAATPAPATSNNAQGALTHPAPESPKDSSTPLLQPPGLLSQIQPGIEASSPPTPIAPSMQNAQEPSGHPSIAESASVNQHTNKTQVPAERVNDPEVPSANADPAKVPLVSGVEHNDQIQSAGPASATQIAIKPRRQPAQTVDGFNLHDVPELLLEADAAEERRDYRLARYSYNLVLRLDPNNPNARLGLHRVLTAQQSH